MKLHGFRRDPAGYEPLPLDDQGRLWVGTLGIWLAVGDRRVICIGDRTGQKFPDYVELDRARAEKEFRIRDLEAEIRRLRGEA